MGSWYVITTSFDMVFLCTKIVQLWNYYCFHQMKCHHGFKLVLNTLKSISLALGTFIFAFGGVIVGSIAGAMKGQTTETGFCRGAAIGAVSGAIVALELFDSIFLGHFLSKVAVFGSIFNGKAFREWVSPAVLKAYQWQQTSMNETEDNTSSDIYNLDEVQGMSIQLINKLPMINFCSTSSISNLPFSQPQVSCTICLQDFIEDEKVRKLPVCEHLFHIHCIDKWLERRTSCPICRNTICSEGYY